MNTPKHWKLQKNKVLNYFHIVSKNATVAYVPDKANVSLILSTPDLFHALEFLLDTFERHTAGYSQGYEINNLACENAKNVIAKALNKQQTNADLAE